MNKDRISSVSVVLLVPCFLLMLCGCTVEEELPNPISQSNYFNPNLTYGSVSDCSGNTYRTIQIGNQEWMAENLKTICYQNGDVIENVPNDNNWNNLNSGAWAYYLNDSSFNLVNGKLYNYFATVDERNLCPSGWHVPSDQEWMVLFNTLGGIESAGTALKAVGTIVDETGPWQGIPYAEPTNSSGFTAIPAGVRFSTGEFTYFTQAGVWWSTTPNINYPDLSWSFNLFSGSHEVDRYSSINQYGYSIRCIKD